MNARRNDGLLQQQQTIALLEALKEHIGAVATVARSIGGIEAKQDIFIEEFKRERDGAADHRQALRDTIAALSEGVRKQTSEMAVLSNEVAELMKLRPLLDQVPQLQRDIAEMKPLVAEFRTTRDQAIGAARFGRFIWAGLVMLSGMIGALVMRLLDGWRPPPG